MGQILHRSTTTTEAIRRAVQLRSIVTKVRKHQWHTATDCNVMLLPGVQSIIHAEGVRCRGCGSIETDAAPNRMERGSASMF